MLKAVLFDLDDTLLASDMDVFLPPYLKALGAYAQPLIDADRFVPALLASTRKMIEDPDTRRTNREVFWECFTHLTGLEQTTTEPFLEGFYGEHFGKLAGLTQQVPSAPSVVDACLQRGLQVVIATNPVFPLLAIEARLRWAGISDMQRFRLITSYENMCSTKPRPQYFDEILRELGCAPNEALMVGNDPRQDIEPARAAGLHTLWVESASQVRPGFARENGPRERDAAAPGPLLDVLPLLDAHR